MTEDPACHPLQIFVTIQQRALSRVDGWKLTTKPLTCRQVPASRRSAPIMLRFGFGEAGMIRSSPGGEAENSSRSAFPCETLMFFLSASK